MRITKKKERMGYINSGSPESGRATDVDESEILSLGVNPSLRSKLGDDRSRTRFNHMKPVRRSQKKGRTLRPNVKEECGGKKRSEEATLKIKGPKFEARGSEDSRQIQSRRLRQRSQRPRYIKADLKETRKGRFRGFCDWKEGKHLESSGKRVQS